MATKFEVIEVTCNTHGHGPAERKSVAICATPAVAQTTLIQLATAAYQEAANGSPMIKAYAVRPIEIELPGFVEAP